MEGAKGLACWVWVRAGKLACPHMTVMCGALRAKRAAEAGLRAKRAAEAELRAKRAAEGHFHLKMDLLSAERPYHKPPLRGGRALRAGATRNRMCGAMQVVQPGSSLLGGGMVIRL